MSPPREGVGVVSADGARLIDDPPRNVGIFPAFRVQGYRNVQWFRGGLVFKAHRLCVSLNSRRESNK